MKTFTLFAAFLCSALYLSAQGPVKSVGDTLGPWTVISFEEPSSYIHIIPNSQNLWQIGAPQKTYFNQAWSVSKAIVTDTLNPYTVNTHSSFDLYIGDFNANGGYYWDLFIDFRHKFDSDTLKDGGYITVSWDHGQSWMNILDDTLSKQHFFASPANNWGLWGNTRLYGAGDTLYNGEHGYSGRSDGWVHSCMAWYDLPVKNSALFPPDTMILRFNFISDNLNHNREGWMIDHIRIFSIDLGSGIRDYMAGNKRSLVTPNPVRSSSRVTLDKTYDDVEYHLLDETGRIVSKGNPGKCDEFDLGCAGLSPGLYLLKISMDRNYSETHRIVVAD